ncbi:calcium-binding protein [Streptomyces sp. McG8]|uniref:calcium-binding protein n=1 Tax=Streptomyces sp. McG8 TaxID=2725487 RepID=UPI002036D4C1|nr:hypothetical protein [Streptomyces sp. McG8]
MKPTAEPDAMVEEAIVDAYDEHEQLAAFQTVIEDRLALPFTTSLGIPVTVTALQDRPGSPTWLFVEGPQGPEPAWLWLTEQGLPMLPDRWNTVFRQVNQ